MAHETPDSLFTPEELETIKHLVVLRDEARKASTIAALKIKAIETTAKLRSLEDKK